MGEFFPSITILLAAVLTGYALGALPVAERISRRHGVDIFSVGSGQAGASNVRRTVGPYSALVVLLADIGKGVLAIFVGQHLGLDGPWILLPGAAAIAGHWNSVFTGFRGGDGLATLGGVIIAMFPVYGLISAVVASVVSFIGQKMPYSSLLGIVFGYMTLVMLNFAYDGDLALTLGIGGVSGLVLAHAIKSHMIRRRSQGWDEVAEAEGATEQTGLPS